MKKALKNKPQIMLIIAAVVTLTVASIVVVAAPPVCLVCQSIGGCEQCVYTDTGWYSCSTPTCYQCNESQRCGARSPLGTGSYSYSVVLEQRIIREIGLSHPRFALTLESLSEMPHFESGVISHWMPVEVKTEHVNLLFDNLKEYSNIFNKPNPQAAELPTIDYRTTIQESPDSPTVTITMKATKPSKLDPPYSTLKVMAEVIGGEAHHMNTKQLKITSWQLE